MGFNYGLEKKRFESEFMKFRQACKASEMSDKDIETIREYDWEQFKSERNYRMHTQPIDNIQNPDNDPMEDSQSPLLKKFLSHLSIPPKEINDSNRENWFEDLEDVRLITLIKVLTQAELDVLTGLIIDGLSQAELSRVKNVSRTAITNRMNNIKYKFQKICKQG